MHGVIVKEDGTTVAVSLGEHPSDPVFTIADLLPHLAQKEMGKTLSDAFEAEKLNVILGHSPEKKADGAEKKEQTGDADKAKDQVKARMLRLLHERYGGSFFCGASGRPGRAGARRRTGQRAYRRLRPG